MEGTDLRTKDEGQKTRDRYRAVRRTKKWAIWIAITSVAIMAGVIITWFFLHDFKMSLKDWTDVTSIVGSICGPLFAFSAALFFWSSIELQQIELASLRAENAKSRFDSSFFSMMNLLKSQINTANDKFIKQGTNAFKAHLKDFYDAYARINKENNPEQQLLHDPKGYTVYFFEKNSELGAIFETSRSCIQFCLANQTRKYDETVWQYLILVQTVIGYEGVILMGYYLKHLLGDEHLDKFYNHHIFLFYGIEKQEFDQIPLEISKPNFLKQPFFVV